MPASGVNTPTTKRRRQPRASVEQALFLLREWRRREMVRIAWRDIAGTAAVAETLQAVSDLADATIRAAAASAELHLLPIFGKPQRSNPAQSPFIVLGMGKLGGRELNFSSDIDLIFLFTEAGETERTAGHRQRGVFQPPGP